MMFRRSPLVSTDPAGPLSSWPPARVRVVLLVLLALVVITHGALAAPAGGADAVWNAPLQSLLDILSGTTARIIGALAFVVGGIMWAFTRMEEGARRFAQAVIGIAIMIGAANLVDMFAFAGATI
jgi:type IV secretory pathway VirB2 component (pilin)